MHNHNKPNSIVNLLNSHVQLICLLLWVGFLGWEIWQHSQQALKPPVYDAASYFFKARNVWNELSQPGWANPFNTDPSVRPPGAVLMAYPFGFDADFRPFFFRSIFLPIALIALAVVIAGYRRELDDSSKWLLILFAVFFTGFPCFYAFEISYDLPWQTYWGMVDGFITGVSALAIAAVMRSAWTQSLGWVGLSALLACLAFTIKPSGGLVMLLTGLAWLVIGVLSLTKVGHDEIERKKMLCWVSYGTVLFVVVYIAIIAISSSSAYFSEQNIKFGNVALAILKKESSIQSWIILWPLALPVVGYAFMVWLPMMLIMVSCHIWWGSTNADPWSKKIHNALLFISLITVLVGVWFWLVFSGGVSQIRYFMPFLFMALILAMPAMLTSVRASPRWTQLVVSAIMLAPAITMGMLLPQQDPPHDWQKWAGVNLTSGDYDPALDQALEFAKTVKREGRNVKLYAMAVDAAETDFQSVLTYAYLTKQPMPNVIISLPVDWVRGMAFRVKEMLDSEYWLFRPVLDENQTQSVSAISSIDSYNLEEAIFQAWATHLTMKDGIEIVSETPISRLLRITNPSLLEAKIEELISKHRWRREFVEANPTLRYSE